MAILRARAVAAAFAVASFGVSGVAFAVSPPTIYDNFHMFPVGSRAAGMGGAYTALACDEGALHYNPAALACAGSSRLELTANAYMLQSFSVPNAFGEGQDISAITYHTIPTIVGGVRILRDGDAQTNVGRLTFGISVSVPNTLALRVDPANPDQINYLSYAVRDDITAGDIGIAYQLHKTFGIGLSLGAVLRTYEARLSTLITSDFDRCPQPSISCRDFAYITYEEAILAVGARAKLGARFAPTDALSFGLTVTSPTLPIYGTYSKNETDTFTLTNGAGVSGGGAIPIRLEGSSEVGFPLRVAAGVAYSTPRFTLSFDASLNVYLREVRLGYDITAVEIDGLPPTDVDTDPILLRPAPMPNFNLGVEFMVARDVVLDLGAFTDLSSVSDVDIEERQLDRVHMFGGTAAIGLLGKQSRGWFGLSFEYGTAQTPVQGGAFNLETFLQTGFAPDATSTITRWTLAGVIGSNYSFLKE